MRRERIKVFEEIVLPFFTDYLLKENYENLGKSDAEEFEKDFKEILELADKAIEQGLVHDKARGEILDLADSDAYGDYQQGFSFGLMRAAQIIDKYKAESEEALEQEPRWVLYEGDGYADGKMDYDMATCPNCGHEFDEGDSNWQEACFCPNCGQALRWE